METRQAEYKTDIGQLQAYVAVRIDGLAVDNARRETRMLLTMVGIVFSVVALATTVLGILITNTS